MRRLNVGTAVGQKIETLNSFTDDGDNAFVSQLLIRITCNSVLNCLSKGGSGNTFPEIYISGIYIYYQYTLSVTLLVFVPMLLTVLMFTQHLLFPHFSSVSVSKSSSVISVEPKE